MILYVMLKQVPYYMDCLARSRHSHPTKWVAMVDLDEFFLPTPFNRATASSKLTDFLDSHGQSIGSICLGRTQVRGPSVLTTSTLGPHSKRAKTPLPVLSRFSTQKLPSQNISQWNLKCFHKISAIQIAFVHWPESFRDHQPATDRKIYFKEQDDLPRIMHLRHDELDMEPLKFEYPVTDDWREWVDTLWRERDNLVEDLPE